MHRLLAFLPLIPLGVAAEGVLKVRIHDSDHKTMVPARVNVIGSDNAFYQPAPIANPLYEFSLKRKGNRLTAGPLRYYSSFFYTTGSFEIQLPPGPARIEVARGYDYYTSTGFATVAPGKTTEYEVTLQRLVDMPRHGWHSTDTHLHFDRASAATDHTIARLLAAEDVELGYILTAESSMGYGILSLYSEGAYSMVSGREVTTRAQGHINLLMIDEMIPAVRRSPGQPGLSSAPPPGLPLAALLRSSHRRQRGHAARPRRLRPGNPFRRRARKKRLGRADAVRTLPPPNRHRRLLSFAQRGVPLSARGRKRLPGL